MELLTCNLRKARERFTYSLLKCTNTPINELKLSDSSDAYYPLLKLNFPNLKAGQVIRIRSATYEEISLAKNVLALSLNYNILNFVGSSKLPAYVLTNLLETGKPTLLNSQEMFKQRCCSLRSLKLAFFEIDSIRQR